MPEKDTLTWIERTLALPVYANPAPDSYGEGVRDTLRTVAKLMRAERMADLIARSSFGDTGAATARETVSDEKARDLVERSKRMMSAPKCDERFTLAGAIGYLDCGRERGHEGIHRSSSERLYWHPAAPPIPWLEPSGS